MQRAQRGGGAVMDVFDASLSLVPRKREARFGRSFSGWARAVTSAWKSFGRGCPARFHGTGHVVRAKDRGVRMTGWIRNVAGIIALSVSGAIATAQDLLPSAGAQRMPVAIVNATVHTVSDGVLENAYIFFDNGRIVEVGVGDRMFIGTTRVIDAEGGDVYPGLILPHTQLGLQEVSAVRATRDDAEVGPVTPEVRAITAINPDTTLIPVARTNGILLSCVFPRAALRDTVEAPTGLIPGQASVIRMDGWTNEDLMVSGSAGLVVNWPRTRPVRAWWMETPEAEQIERMARARAVIEETFDAAEAYRAIRAGDASSPIDLALEAVVPCLPGGEGGAGEGTQRPVFIHANDQDDITSAVAWAAGRGLKAVIVGGRDAPEVAQMLVEHGVAVIVDGLHRFPKRADSAYDEAFTVPARLEAAGVRWCFAGGEEPAHERSLPFNAGRAVAFGLSQEAALRSITLSAAEVLGIDETYGSIEPGKSATIILTTGNVLEATTTVTRAFIDGREIDLRNKQTELIEKYREKYRQLGIIDGDDQ
ncbi:MAG: hypothetical protein EA378_05900 [Phycisphaerales bacterium]|nr:MAG: hypothetical protein EA378_05900 [Phycisphaerales bacterium]